ncbi:hypothetical protein C5S39_14520 [Candidatus Methanophagaceae archaeon]|jgi:hypothetical protein|nr:hypothetical protein C5S39_14520 [Methanophagales archaeon]
MRKYLSDYEKEGQGLSLDLWMCLCITEIKNHGIEITLFKSN